LNGTARAGDQVSLAGDVHVVTLVRQGMLTEIHLNMAGFQGIGQTTDNLYIGTGSQKFSNLAQPLTDVPAFCRVQGVSKPSTDSNILFEAWLPASTWNGKFLSAGEGGYVGTIGYAAIALNLQKGYATVSTDTGHLASDTFWAIGHPQRAKDYLYRAKHLVTVATKGLIRAYYGRSASRNYFQSCSNGGRQALIEIQRYTDDFDGLIVGAPWNFQSHSNAGFVWDAQALSAPGAAIRPAQLPAITAAALAACDGNDGLVDGLITDPLSCKFNPDVLLCAGAETDSCLTAAQLTALKKIYAGPKNPRTGEQIFPPPYPGSELTWYRFTEPKPFALADDFFRYFVFKDANWDPKKRPINFDTDVALADSPQNGVVNAMDPDLSKFVGRGGKFLLYEGWSDTSIPPDRAIQYYKDVVAKLGTQKAKDSVRLFMVPGMAHCSAGEAHGTFDSLKVLEQWVENKKPPGEIVVSRINEGKVVRTRRLCQYPLVATYKGTGSTDDAANFVCKASAK